MNSPSDKDQQAEIDRLLAEAKKLQQRSSKSGSGDRATNRTRVTGTTGYTLLFRFMKSFKEAWLGFYEQVLSPMAAIFGPPLRWSGRGYASLWKRLVFKSDPQTGERILSRKRAGVVIASTLLFLLAFTPTSIGNAVRFVTIEPVIDGILMATSLRTETFYLNSSEEIDPAENVHSVRGCKSEGRCTEKDAAYFRVRPRLAHDVWKFIKYKNPVYVPDHVVAPIAPGVNKCSVTYYGYRMTSSWIARLLRSLQVYPTMLEASCEYITGPNTNIM